MTTEATAAQPAKLKLVDENTEAQQSAHEAERAFKTITQYANAVRLSWWDVGRAVLAVHEKHFWSTYEVEDGGEPYHSYEDFINRVLQKARSSAYRAERLARELSTLTDEDARRIPLVKAAWLLKLKLRAGDSKWCNPKWIEKATDPTISEDDFAELVNAALPGAAKEEELITYTFRLPKSLARQLDKLLKMGKRFGECEDDEGALEWAIAYVFNGQCESVTFKASNLDVFDNKKRAPKKAAKK